MMKPAHTSSDVNLFDTAALRAWVGSRLVVGFEGTEPGDQGIEHARKLAEDGDIGGLIFFHYNVTSPAQMARLTQTIRSWDVPAANRPLLLMIDQEGGQVQRLDPKKGFSGWPCAHDVGQGSDEQAQGTFAGLAQELERAGINFNAAPVVDLHDPNSPAIGKLKRSFGTQVEQVIRRAGQSVQAHLASGVVPVLKHFPGHGSAQGDTHRGLTDVSCVWRNEELDAFAEVINSHDVPAVMTSHLINNRLDAKGLPATFSTDMIANILRHKLGFDGVVITDDLGMGAIQQQYGLEDTVQRALACSHDLLCFGLNQAAAGKGLPAAYCPIERLTDFCMAAVQAGITAGSIDAALMSQSSRRLDALRARLRG